MKKMVLAVTMMFLALGAFAQVDSSSPAPGVTVAADSAAPATSAAPVETIAPAADAAPVEAATVAATAEAPAATTSAEPASPAPTDPAPAASAEALVESKPEEATASMGDETHPANSLLSEIDLKLTEVNPLASVIRDLLDRIRALL